MNKNEKIFIAGHQGLVGSALLRNLKQRGYSNFALKTSSELDLRRQSDTEFFFAGERPAYVFLAAAKVGGILANSTYKADFIYDNMAIACNVINSAYKFGVRKVLNLGSSCIYPKFASQPLKEEYLLTGPLETTNEPYAIAKIAAIKLCRYYNEQYGTNYISAMPANLYGPNDNFDQETSHVLPALIRKFHEAKIAGRKNVTIWGTGKPSREFLHADDLADACILLMERYDFADIGEFINIGSGYEITINELAKLISDIVGFDGEIKHDITKPDGAPRKILDTSRFTTLGWRARIEIKTGITKTYENFIRTKSV
jgi:GDP-L-fucose synthase